MTVHLEAVAFDVVEPGAVATFWARLLGRTVVPEATGALLPGDETQVGLRFVATPADEIRRSHLHLHVTSESLDDQRRTVETALSLGGTHLDVGQLPDEPHVVLADPGGNAFCVIEPGNRFLAGCGPLGEVTCEGTREVGLFWRDALGWPLVWDQDDETAVQSPAGGTKVSWGGEPATRRHEGSRQRLDLVATDPDAAAARLVGLGAGREGGRDGVVTLTDPDGNELRLARPTTEPPR
ncbi:VOC family protein [Cellulomonas sp. HZM]|uniref:VOC family protein n=1 Tax=Cellulomonas sp. HZM TaxID=1454010 RepID=UPI000492F0A3|nr:VOC family protein [Cellulomonas sp. HZM]